MWHLPFEGGAVYPTLVDDDGRLWSGSAGSGVLGYTDQRWQALPVPPGLLEAEVYDLAQAPAGKIWVASSKGVWVFDPPEVL